MPDDLHQFWKSATIVLLAICGVWLWMKVKIERIERERDKWKELAETLLKKYADVDLPPTAVKNGEKK
jgi:hypothetical protein